MTSRQEAVESFAPLCPLCGRTCARMAITPGGMVICCEACATERMLGAQLISLEEWGAVDAATDVLERFGLAGAQLGKTPQTETTQPRAQIWEVEATDRRFVLKRYRPELDEEAIRHEHNILAHLAGRRFAVAAPLPDASGGTWVEAADALWALFPALDGAQAQGQDWMWRMTKASGMLAELHAGLRDCQPAGRAGPRCEVWSLRRLDDMLAQWPRLQPLAMDLVANVRTHLASGFFDGVYEALPRTMIHGEYVAANVLWRGETVTGVLDWTRAHVDTPLYDFATGISTRWPPMLRGLVATYTRVAPLSQEERAALPEALLLGALIGIDAQLVRAHNPQAANHHIQELAFMMRDVEGLRKAALAAR